MRNAPEDFALSDLKSKLAIAKQMVKDIELSEEELVPRDGDVRKRFYDSLEAHVTKIVPNPRYELATVYNEEGEVIKESAIVYMRYPYDNFFRLKDLIYVKPVRNGEFELVGEYNKKGQRILGT